MMTSASRTFVASLALRGGETESAARCCIASSPPRSDSSETSIGSSTRPIRKISRIALRAVASTISAWMLKREVEETLGLPIEMHVDRPIEAIEALTARGFLDAALFGPHVRVLSREPAADLKRIPAILEEAGVKVHLAESRTLSMEDVFVHRVRALEEREGGRGEGG